MALGETIALLEGLDMVNLAAASGPRREVPISSMPARGRVEAQSVDDAFLSYMNDSGVGAGTTMRVMPAVSGDLSGLSYSPSVPLIPSSVGLSADLAESVSLLEGQAHLGRQMHRKQPRGDVRDALVSGGSENFYAGNTVVEPATLFPGASLTFQGLSATTPRRAPTRADALPDAWLRQHFADDKAYAMFVTFAGEKKVREVFRARGTLKQTPNLYWGNERTLLILLTARRRLFQAQHQPWTSVDVARILGNAQVEVSQERTTKNGVAGLEGLNNSLAGLEGRIGRRMKSRLKKVGRITAGVMTGGASEAAYALRGADLGALEGKVGRKIRKGLKKAVKATGKVALAVGKAGASYMTGGASNLVVDAASSAVQKKKKSPVASHSRIARGTQRQQQPQVARPAGTHSRLARGRQQYAPQPQYAPEPQYAPQPQYGGPIYDEGYAPTAGGDYAPSGGDEYYE